MMFEPYLERWNLTPDGEPIITNYGGLLPVRRDGELLMLKIAFEPEERRGSGLMVWWEGEGAARGLEYDGETLLMERVTGPRSLGDLSRSGGDDEATRILCDVAAKLHTPRDRPQPELVPLDLWFAALWPVAEARGGLLERAADAARVLLSTERDRVVLHGDLHHNNVLDGEERGWLAIDPKALYGERTFDFTNILRNPDIETSLIPGRFARQVDVIADAANLDRTRFLMWMLAYTGLSAAWFITDGREPTSDLAIAGFAADLLDQARESASVT
jgi:streptomycin 6-kinase